MAKLIYSAIGSLDGYVEDSTAASTGLRPTSRCTRSSMTLSARSAPIFTGGGCTRRWCSGSPRAPAAINPRRHRDFAQIWQAAEKIVYSRTIQTLSSARTRIERDFDPAAIRRLKESSDSDISVGGAELAGRAIAAGLVDECHLFLCPIVVGGGKRALPDDVRAELELLAERRFRSGVVHLHYRVRSLAVLRHARELGHPGHPRPDVAAEALHGGRQLGGADHVRGDASRIERDPVGPRLDVG